MKPRQTEKEREISKAIETGRDMKAMKQRERQAEKQRNEEIFGQRSREKLSYTGERNKETERQRDEETMMQRVRESDRGNETDGNFTAKNREREKR
jgi:hypothetical protein